LYSAFKALWGRIYKKSLVFLGGINGPKRNARTWKMLKGVVIQDLREPMKTLKISESGAFRQTFNSQTILLCGNTEAVT
jgi:hypothetical protein